MNKIDDIWYVRLPDGRVVRAKSAQSVRRHVERGRIPVDSWARRTGDDEWQALEWLSEFADLAKLRDNASPMPLAAATSHADGARSSRPAARAVAPAGRPADELHTAGVRGLVEELFNALDSTLQRPKLVVAVLIGLCSGIVLALFRYIPFDTDVPLDLAPWIGIGLVWLLLVAFGSALLTQMTVVELSRLRPARTQEARHHLVRNALRIAVAYLVVGGIVVAGVMALRALPDWLLDPSDVGTPGADVVAGLTTALALLLEVLLWPILGLALLLAPILVIEECGLFSAFRQWAALLQRRLGRVILYEALAATLGAVASLAFLFPIVVAGSFSLTGESLHWVKWLTLSLLAGPALSPLFAFLVVANVYIYVTLRYEFYPARS